MTPMRIASDDYAHERLLPVREQPPYFTESGTMTGYRPLIVLSSQVVRRMQAADCSDRKSSSHELSRATLHPLCSDVAPLMEANWDMGGLRSLKMSVFSCITPSGRAHEAEHRFASTNKGIQTHVLPYLGHHDSTTKEWRRWTRLRAFHVESVNCHRPTTPRRPHNEKGHPYLACRQSNCTITTTKAWHFSPIAVNVERGDAGR